MYDLNGITRRFTFVNSSDAFMMLGLLFACFVGLLAIFIAPDALDIAKLMGLLHSYEEFGLKSCLVVPDGIATTSSILSRTKQTDQYGVVHGCESAQIHYPSGQVFLGEHLLLVDSRPEALS